LQQSSAIVVAQPLQQAGASQVGAQQLGAAQLGAAQQLGAAGAQQVGAAGAQQVGAAGAQQLGSAQHEGSQQLPQQPPRPSIRSSSVAPNVWLHKPALTTSAPKSMFHFIEQHLLCMEPGLCVAKLLLLACCRAVPAGG
jgi:hypothetical protein